MHGRVLLPPLFFALAPLSVVPVWWTRVPGGVALQADPVQAADTFGLRETAPQRLFGRVTGLFWRKRRIQRVRIAACLACWMAIVGWAGYTVSQLNLFDADNVSISGIVDERSFYVLRTGHEHPILAKHYADFPRIHAMEKAVAAAPQGAVVFSAGDFNYWYTVPTQQAYDAGLRPHKPSNTYRATAYFLNLGMSSMNVGLDVRVIDQMGLAYPLAAHTQRQELSRIGHDKFLFPEWVVAESGWDRLQGPWPQLIRPTWVLQAARALTCQQTQDLLDSYRSELTWARFKQNVKRSFEFAQYRINRIPEQEIRRCHL